MYEELTGSRKTIGDIDVVYHDGLYHIFHLVLPNHDFIAHAVSEDGFTWSRVENALFIGHPGTWDDSMLWTMHVSPDPAQPGNWRMFYTGIAQHDHGLEQRIGLAHSSDLYQWHKSPVRWVNRCERCRVHWTSADEHTSLYDEESVFPLESAAPYYESSLDEGRRWISWRDPYYCHDGQRGRLLVSARVADGPIVRRGCVGLLEEVAPNHFEVRPPLFHPGLYDDVEVPNLLSIDDRHYLIGSLREDAKVRYWYSDSVDGPWSNYSDNVLLPKGNYAARISRNRDDDGYLLWSFFTHDPQARTVKNLVLPPKHLCRGADGQLVVSSFDGFDQLIHHECSADELGTVILLHENRRGHCESEADDGSLLLTSHHGYQGFLLAQEFESFRLSGRLALHGEGKCGLLIRVDPETHDGYYLSLDLRKGLAQLRAWGTNLAVSGEHMMKFQPLQAAYWRSYGAAECDIRFLAYGSYLECSVNGAVVLSLADQTYAKGAVGVYAESACVRVSGLRLEHLLPRRQSDEHLAAG